MSRESDRSNVTSDRNITFSLGINALPTCSLKINYGVIRKARSLNWHTKEIRSFEACGDIFKNTPLMFAINVDWIPCKIILAKNRQRAVIATVSFGRDNMYSTVFIVMCTIYSFVRMDFIHTWQSGQVLFIGISIPAIISIRDQCLVIITGHRISWDTHTELSRWKTKSKYETSSDDYPRYTRNVVFGDDSLKPRDICK